MSYGGPDDYRSAASSRMPAKYSATPYVPNYRNQQTKSHAGFWIAMIVILFAGAAVGGLYLFRPKSSSPSASSAGGFTDNPQGSQFFPSTSPTLAPPLPASNAGGVRYTSKLGHFSIQVSDAASVQTESLSKTFDGVTLSCEIASDSTFSEVAFGCSMSRALSAADASEFLHGFVAGMTSGSSTGTDQTTQFLGRPALEGTMLLKTQLAQYVALTYSSTRVYVLVASPSSFNSFERSFVPLP